MPNNYFDIKRDNETISAGGFFCEACLVGRLLDDISPDSRYCQGCYDFLVKEVELLGGKRPKWVPKRVDTKSKSSPKKAILVTQHVDRIMSTLEGKKNKVDIIPPTVGKVTREKRGPKHRALPEDLIRQWASEAMGSKAIAARLKDELHITVSYKTIQRILSRQRVLVDV